MSQAHKRPRPGHHVETLYNPLKYSQPQVDQMCLIAATLERGLLLVTEHPDEP